MSVNITIRDESTSGEAISELCLEFLTEEINVRELIRSRVYQEVKDYNVKQPEYYRGLIQPDDTEKTLNGYKMRKARTIDWQKQFDAALDAFRLNQIMILVDDRQVEDLQEQLTLTPDTQVSFLKLTPLIGG